MILQMESNKNQKKHTDNIFPPIMRLNGNNNLIFILTLL